MKKLIDIQDISFCHPDQTDDRPILNHISLQIEQGEFVAIVGANGSGKTTLARHLNGLYTPTNGKVLINGLDTQSPKNLNQIRKTIGMVFQYPEDQIIATTVEEDVAFGPENLGMPISEIRNQVDWALRRVGLWQYRHRPPYLLSAGQMQRVGIAGVIAMRPSCIVFDEATAMLDPQGRKDVLSLMKEFHQEGLTVIFITHFMEEAVQADRIIVVNDGWISLDGAPDEIFSDQVDLEAYGLELPKVVQIGNILQQKLPGFSGRFFSMEALLDAIPFALVNESVSLSGEKNEEWQINEAEEVLISVKELDHTYAVNTPMAHQALDGVDLQVRVNQAHGLLGATGSGKSTLLQHLNGIYRPQQGQVRVGPFDMQNDHISMRDVCQYAGLVFQIPENQFFEQYVGDEIAFGPKQFGLTGQPLRERVKWAMELVELDFDEFKDRFIQTLSGGEKRKVALASVLANEPKLLILDEPTAGLDPQTRILILERLVRLKENGMQMILSSHHMDDVAKLCSEVTLLLEGKDISTGESSLILSDIEKMNRVGLEPPIASLVTIHMREKGWQIPPGIITMQDFAKSLEQIGGIDE
jgi:energy-coupling factor transport system ATP-binding protein